MLHGDANPARFLKPLGHGDARPVHAIILWGNFAEL